VAFFELFADPGMVEAVLGEKFPVNLHRYIEEPDLIATSGEIEGLVKSIEMYVRFCHEVGYDYVFAVSGYSLRRTFQTAGDEAVSQNWPDGQRYWIHQSHGPIQSRTDFERYPWPKAEEMGHAAVETASSMLPEGMKIAAFLFGGVFEHSAQLMGLESFSYALADQPELIEALCQRVGELATAAASQLVAIENVEMILLADDLGFHGGTLVSPNVIRQHVVPHYKRISEIIHEAGKLLVFHSCGNMYRLMDELIDEIGIDAKHSYEDKILPVEEAYRRWGDRVAILGGVDMDLLARGTEEQVRARTREILEVCGTRGEGYCLGTGNTAANYIPPRNYLAMLDEGRRWNREHFRGA
jgi:uroporphyrinogen decarboxylase